MSMIGKIRRMHFRQRKTVREISRATSLSRNTVRKYLRMAQVREPKYERAAKATKLTPFHETIVTALRAAEWSTVAAAYVQAKRAADEANAALESARTALVGLASHPSESGAGVTVTRYWKRGAPWTTRRCRSWRT